MSVHFAPNDERPTEPAPIPLFGRLVATPLPAPVTPLVGREDATAQIAGMRADPDLRLVTLTGPGGIGKTRLALAVAGQVVGPVAFVSLAATTDTALIVPTIAQALGLEPIRDVAPEVALQGALREHHMLLVLDNFEQLLAGALVVSDLLRGCPGSRVLVTIRVRLSLAGEHVIPVEPLALPEPGSSEEAAETSAVRLFVERARAAHPAFALTAHNTGAVAAICRRLDGLPLAIELAAARSNLLAPEALAARLERRLHVLTGGPHDAPARHQTMRAAISWSYDLLDEIGRRFWERLGIFSGGFTADAADAIGQTLDAPDFDAVVTLQSFIDQGLLRPATNPDGEPRFDMLETTRDYALEQLAASNGADAARAAHAAWFGAFAVAAEPGLMGSDPGPWFNRVEADIANLRAALGWLRDRDEVAAALEIVAARLLGAAAARRALLALPLRPSSQREVDQVSDDLRARLGHAAFTLAWNHGQAMPTADVLREAHAVQIPAPAAADGLSRREREVLSPLVEGASDLEIADRLFITRRTASKHVAAIIEKLGVANRTAAVTAAHRRGLV